ncbi:uncharacterized protein At5g50100, chloroplastic [Strongylocentrotus purpuratus]|uniref:Thiol-disulfide oxidoreductase DCC n=1 Tax=Strongylocentrotus purpuratus TaxID=7668 RepID=A0A7M7RAA7_STRPU|nr:uncharacterized protein At5g50100, chloroplastic [Strongylocentrotus purpuratus]
MTTLTYLRNMTKLCSQRILNDLVCRNGIGKRGLCSTSSLGGTTGIEEGEGLAADIGVNRTGKTKVLYDGECPLCIQEIKLVRYLNNNKDAIHFVDISQPGYNQMEHNNIPFDEAMGIMHVVGPDNTVHKKINAVDAMYRAVGWGWATGFMKWPIFAGLFDRGYMWFARNRLRLTGQQCREGNCKIPDA